MPWQYVPEVDAFSIYHKVQEEHEPDSDFSFSNSFGHAVAGASGTAISNVVVYPLAFVVTRLQVQNKKRGGSRQTDPENAHQGQEQYKGLIDAFSKIYENEGGVSAFYGGVVQDTLKSMADSFLFFLAYNALCNARQHSSTKERNMLSRVVDEVGIGMLAGAFTKGLTFPLQQVVTRKQSGDKSAREASVSQILHEIHHQRGLQGFWSGYSATLILTLNPSLAMSIHSFLERAAVGDGTTGSLLTFLFAASSKAIASSVMYPVSLAKTRAQAAGGSASKDSGGPLSVIRAINRVAHTEGVGALYQGVWGEVLKGFFSHGLTMLVKQRIQDVVIKLYFWLLGKLRALKKS